MVLFCYRMTLLNPVAHAALKTPDQETKKADAASPKPPVVPTIKEKVRPSPPVVGKRTATTLPTGATPPVVSRKSKLVLFASIFVRNGQCFYEAEAHCKLYPVLSLLRVNCPSSMLLV